MTFLNLSHLNGIQSNAERVAGLPEVAAAMAVSTFISCNVCGGRGDLQFRKVAGRWMHRTSYVDRCFGQITQRWQALVA